MGGRDIAEISRPPVPRFQIWNSRDGEGVIYHKKHAPPKGGRDIANISRPLGVK